MQYETTESDWKAYKEIFGHVQARFLEEVNQELIHLLANSDVAPGDRFQAADAKIKSTRKLLQHCFGAYSRSEMVLSLVAMQANRMLREEEIAVFSEEVQAILNGVPR